MRSTGLFQIFSLVLWLLSHERQFNYGLINQPSNGCTCCGTKHVDGEGGRGWYITWQSDLMPLLAWLYWMADQSRKSPTGECSGIPVRWRDERPGIPVTSQWRFRHSGALINFVWLFVITKKQEFFMSIQFVLNFLLDGGSFCWALVPSVSDFGWFCLWVSKPGWIHHRLRSTVVAGTWYQTRIAFLWQVAQWVEHLTKDLIRACWSGF